ncbi:MAG TPA: nuclease-related domain-containing protein [Roseiflexaceae bacterium]|nr:nuclease-related domain-containing protein [Roseiflexaceae bacterium]
MAVQVWIGEKPEHPNERRAIVALANGLERLDGLYLILANFSVGGRTVDLVLIKQDAIFIVELKHCDGKVFGGVNGPWFVEGANGERKRLNPGRKNPYNQVISYYYSLINFLNDHRETFLSPQKATSVDFRTCKRLVVIAPTIQEGSELETDWKVELKGLDELPAYLVTERSSEIDLSDEEMLAIPKLLHCTRWNEINALLAGVLPNWDAVQTTPPPIAPPAPVLVAEPEPAPATTLTAGPWGAFASWQARAAAAALALILIVMLAFQLWPRTSSPPDQANSIIVGTSQPAGGIGSSFSDPGTSCVWSGFQSVGRRRDGMTWRNVGVDGAAPDLTPEVVVTLDEVGFCEGQITLTWSLRNNLDDQSVTLPLSSANIVVRDSLGNEYALDETLSKPAEITAGPNKTGEGQAVIAQSASLNAQTLVIKLKQEPFGESTWVVPIQNGLN